jgi:hypothetical protein
MPTLTPPPPPPPPYLHIQIGKERARHAALMLNLLAGQAMTGEGHLGDAEKIFARLAARTSEGEVAFGATHVGLPPTSIRQEAVRCVWGGGGWGGWGRRGLWEGGKGGGCEQLWVGRSLPCCVH